MINSALAIELRARGWGLFGKTYIAYPAIPPQVWLSGGISPVPGWEASIIIGMAQEDCIPNQFQFFFQQTGKFRGTSPQAGVLSDSIMGVVAAWYYTSVASPLWFSIFNRSAVWQPIAFWLHTLDFTHEYEMIEVKRLIETGAFKEKLPGDGRVVF